MNLVGRDWSNGASPRNIADARDLETSHGRIAKQHDISRRDLSILFGFCRAAEPLTPTRLLAEIALTLAAMAPSQREPELAVFLQLAPEEPSSSLRCCARFSARSKVGRIVRARPVRTPAPSGTLASNARTVADF
jgi:hypothetical protein